MRKLMLLLLLLIVLVACDKEVVNEKKSEIKNQEIEVGEQVDMEVVQELQEEDFLRADGKNIYNQRNELVQLKGVNIGGYLLQEFWMTPTKASEHVKAELDIYHYLEEQYGQERALELIDIYQSAYFTESDFDNLQALGLNVVRLPFWYRNIVDGSGEIIPNWYERFDWFIDQAGKRGIYVILDFHGVPGSQNGSDHSGLDGGEDKLKASEFFFGDEALVKANQELFYDIWDLIASRYQNSPVVAGYDLINEPYCTYRYSSGYSDQELHEKLWSVYDQAYDRIRVIDPDHLIFMEATWDPKDLPHPDTYGWEQVVYEYHNYLYDDYDNDKGLQISNMRKKLNLINNANYPVPSFMGEFSYFSNYDAWSEGLKLINDTGMHWTIWTYKVSSNNGNWGLFHHNGGNINIEAVDDDKLAIIWAKVGDSRPNRRLIEVVEPFFLQDSIIAE